MGGAQGEHDYRLQMDYVLGLTGRERPNVAYVPTASGERADAIVLFYERLGPSRNEPRRLLPMAA